MGAFDYKAYTLAESVDLAQLSYNLAAQSFLQTSVLGVRLEDAATFVEGKLGVGSVTGGKIATALPPGWADLSAKAIGFEGAHIDRDGFIQLESPMTGFANGGPQLKLYGEYADDGSLSRVSISFVATNGIADIADFLILNSGSLTAGMEPMLESLAKFLTSQGLTGDDVLVTGFSLGGAMTNLMARYSDTLAGGFYAKSDYVGHESPVVQDNGRVLNIGFENDVIHRLTGTALSFDDAVEQGDPGLSNPQRDFASTTDNIVIFDGNYAAVPGVTQAVNSVLNPFGWWAHVGAALTDAVSRIGHSAFYDLTEQDSVIVVSNLGADLRKLAWVEDRTAPTSNHYGDPAFIVGTDFDDKLADGRANDYLDGGKGNDLIRTGAGMNVVEGGSGTDTLRVLTWAKDTSAWKLSDGTLVVQTKDGLTLATGVEKVQLSHFGPAGLVEYKVDYSIQNDRLEDEHWSPFELGDEDIRFGRAVEGTANADTLSGSAVFGKEGDDRLSGTAGRDLLHGGRGQDVLTAGAGGDRLYGAEHNDRLVAGANSLLNGGHGDDVFVFTAAATGKVVIEDFNLAQNEDDRISVTQFRDFAALRAASSQSGDGVDIRAGNLTIHLDDTKLADLHANDFIFV